MKKAYLLMLALGLICFNANAQSKTSAYNDVITFDLKGKVKSCKIYKVSAAEALLLNISGEPSEKYSFTSNGKYIPKEGEEVFYNIEDHIACIKCGDEGTQYAYNDSRLITETFIGEFFGSISVIISDYTYDNKGLIIKNEKTSGGKTQNINYYEYELDSKGNWISRKYKIDNGLPNGEVRKIEYY